MKKRKPEALQTPFSTSAAPGSASSPPLATTSRTPLRGARILLPSAASPSPSTQGQKQTGLSGRASLMPAVIRRPAVPCFSSPEPARPRLSGGKWVRSPDTGRPGQRAPRGRDAGWVWGAAATQAPPPRTPIPARSGDGRSRGSEFREFNSVRPSGSRGRQSLPVGEPRGRRLPRQLRRGAPGRAAPSRPVPSRPGAPLTSPVAKKTASRARQAPMTMRSRKTRSGCCWLMQ